MIDKIMKRDGRFVPFDQERIANAIFKAAKSVGGTDRTTSSALSLEVLTILAERFGHIGTVSVEQIQDVVEKVLIDNGHAKTAKAYILYRKQRNDIRDMTDAIKGVETMVDEYIGELDWRVKENSNTTFALQGLNNYISSTITARYWLNKIYSDEIREAHESGALHIHDLGLLAVYCCGWDLQDLLRKGFTGAVGKVESSAPKHFRSALGQIVNFFYTLQGEAAGAQAFANFDTLLAPFIALDNLSYKEVKQSMQEFVFNLNIPTRVGFQTPFTNLTMDLNVPSMFKNEPIIIGGEYQERTYGEFQYEMDMINKAFIEVMEEGDAKGRIFTFPIPTYNVTEDFNWDNPIVDDLMKITGKYGTPYFANFVNSDMDPEDARSMCCRLRLDNRELRKRGGGLFGANPLTGSIGVVTINLPQLAFKCDGDEQFFSELDKLLEIGRQSLIIKRKTLEKLTTNGLYPYSKHYLTDMHTRTGQYWKNHFNTIGIVGMNEALLNYVGIDITYNESKEFAARVLNHINDKITEFQLEDDMLYNLEATPAEGTAYRLARIDKKSCPGIVHAGTNEAPYYTNSTQIPADRNMDLFSALNHQNDLQTLYTGGTVFHMFLGEAVDDPASVKKLLQKVTSEYELPYYTVTPTFSICPVHGYINGSHDDCPICREEKIEELIKEIEELKNEDV